MANDKGLFGQPIAEHFYSGVRCALLHEARTQNGWKLQVKHGSGPFFDVEIRIVCREQLQMACIEFVDWYGKSFLEDQDIQEAFIR